MQFKPLKTTHNKKIAKSYCLSVYENCFCDHLYFVTIYSYFFQKKIIIINQIYYMLPMYENCNRKIKEINK